MMYKLLNANTEFECLIIENSDGSVKSIPSELANTDYQAYLAWVAEGGVPLPADEVA